MFEGQKIRREFQEIVATLSRSEALPVDPEIYDFFVAQEKDAAVLMKRQSWTSFGACIFLISDVCNYLAEEGRLEELRQRSERVYRSLRNLYQFALLAVGKRPDAEAAFSLPKDGQNPSKD